MKQPKNPRGIALSPQQLAKASGGRPIIVHDPDGIGTSPLLEAREERNGKNAGGDW
jgi:hypothetical protein